MWKGNLYAEMEKLEVQICRCTRQGLKVMPCPLSFQTWGLMGYVSPDDTRLFFPVRLPGGSVEGSTPENHPRHGL